MNGSRVASELLKDIRDHIGCLYQLAECLSMIDLLLSFAHNCTLSDYGECWHVILSLISNFSLIL